MKNNIFKNNSHYKYVIELYRYTTHGQINLHSYNNTKNTCQLLLKSRELLPPFDTSSYFYPYILGSLIW